MDTKPYHIKVFSQTLTDNCATKLEEWLASESAADYILHSVVAAKLEETNFESFWAITEHNPQ